MRTKKRPRRPDCVLGRECNTKSEGISENREIRQFGNEFGPDSGTQTNSETIIKGPTNGKARTAFSTSHTVFDARNPFQNSAPFPRMEPEAKMLVNRRIRRGKNPTFTERLCFCLRAVDGENQRHCLGVAVVRFRAYIDIGDRSCHQIYE